MTPQFKIISLYKRERQVLLQPGGKFRQMAVGELWFPSLSLTMRNVRLLQSHVKPKPFAYLPTTQRDGLHTLQIGDRAMLERIAAEMLAALPDAPLFVEDDHEEAA